MLTARGFWFFVATFALLAVAVLLAATQLMLLSATLLFWFLSQWFLFQVRARLSVRRLTIARSLRSSRGEVESVWARQRLDIVVTLRSDGPLALPYAVATDRLPALGRLREGTVCVDGTLSKENPLTIAYALECRSTGWLRFEGVKVQLADLQGFFVLNTFVHDLREYRVLPTFAVDAAHASFVKQHNVLPLLGSHRHARPGSSSELLDLRDYLPGDPPKMIAWKVSARRDRLITREFESEVPIRCTLFVDTSNSVRVGPVGETPLCRLVEIAAGVAQANVSERDLTGLCLFDETGVREYVKPGRGASHLLKLIGCLTDVAGLIPHSPRATVRELVPVAYGLAQDLYPDWLDRDVNYFPLWLPFWSPQPNSTIPPGAPRDGSRLSPAYHREYRWRKELAAIFAVRYDLGAGGLAMLLEDDERCVYFLQRFLAEHQVAYPFPHYDGRGRYLFAAPKKPRVLADALLKAITRGKDNELFVLFIDLLENTDHLEALEKAVCIAKARHHQVIVICPWPQGVDAPGSKPSAAVAGLDWRLLLLRICTTKLHQAFADVQHAFGRIGVNVLCAADGHSINGILHRMRRLRIQEKGGAMNEPAAISPRHYQALSGLALAAICLIQLQHSSFAGPVTMVVNVLIAIIGAAGIFYRARFSPVLLLIALTLPMVIEHYNLTRDFAPEGRGARFLDVVDVLLCMAVLTYFIGHYRLQGLWFGVLPTDVRDGSAKDKPPRVRSEESLNATELASLVFTIPAFALLAQVAGFMLRRQGTMIDLPPRWAQFVTVSWAVLLAMFLAAHAFRHWRRLQLDRVGALILLQDLVWNETRGEQRRIQRWLAWKKLRDKK